MRRP
jgi:transposase